MLISKIGIFLKGLYYKSIFERFGHGSNIDNPLYLMGAKNISIGANSTIRYKTWLAALPLTGRRQERCQSKIGNSCSIGHFNEIFATNSIVIEDGVLTADRVYIADNSHEYSDISLPIRIQPVRQLTSVVIGAGSWIGVGACVIGASIGKHCVIGANSVVTRDIPDYSVAVGAPAKVIKRYNFSTQRWERTNSNGQLINVCPKNFETGIGNDYKN